MVTNGGDNPSPTVKTLLKWHVKITGENEYSPQYFNWRFAQIFLIIFAFTCKS